MLMGVIMSSSAMTVAFPPLLERDLPVCPSVIDFVNMLLLFVTAKTKNTRRENRQPIRL